MKIYGKVTDYNGDTGNIIGVDGKEYLVLEKDILDNEKIQKNSAVIFTSEIFETPEYSRNIARFVKILKRNNENS